MKKINILILTVITTFTLIGCGGESSSGSNSSTNTTGTFIDNKVAGIKYINGTASGYTDANGNFPYTSGTVSFYIGDIKIGEISSLPSDKNVFIQDILGVDRTDTSNTKVLKIASLIQSLDSDSTTDVIEITQSDFDKFKNQSITSIDDNTDISTLLTNLNITKVSDEDTKKHLDNSLKEYGVTSDTTAPMLNNTSISVSSIVLAFSEDIKKDTINSSTIILTDSNSNVIECDLISKFDIITIKPKSNLSYSTTYTLTLKSNIQDYSKNSLAETTISFTTQSNTETVIFNNISYGIITSPITGKKWLDRNLGASQACTSSTDTACYGDYYQWGRLADGHEKSSSTTTSTRASSITNVGNQYITGKKATEMDWTTADEDGSLRTAQWRKTDGTGVCPVGYRVPTISELEVETIKYAGVNNITTGAVKVTDSTTAFQNFLKFPVPTARVNDSIDNPSSAWLWSSSSSEHPQSLGFYFIDNNNIISSNLIRNYGLSVRCVEGDSNVVSDTTAPTITSASSFSVNENQTSAFTVTATDSSAVTYSLSGTDANYFNINSTTGVVTFKTAPDYEATPTKTSYSLTVKATDTSNNVSTKDVTINITDTVEAVTYNNITYGIITSPITNKRWLDRNIGASQACTSSTDTACYGDYYQWGRLADGHEKSSSTTTSTRASTITNVGNQFIYGSSDWTTADVDGDLRTAQWRKTDGTGICPSGFRVPTQTELVSETTGYTGSDNTTTGAIKVTNSTTAFSNFLKLPVAGLRFGRSNSMSYQASTGFMWTTTYAGSKLSNAFYFESRGINWYSYNYTNAFSVRCIEDASNVVSDTTAPTITSASSFTVNENQINAFTATATDTNGISSYTLSGTDSSYFNINSTTGVVTFITAPDYETKTSYSLTVTATDTSNNSSTQNVTVNILDVVEDTTAPTITSASTFNVNENQTTAFSIISTDSSAVTYSLSGTDSSYFNINSTTGVVTFKIAPNYEVKTSYSLTVTATDASNNTTTQNVTISISDIDEVAPTITSASSFTVNENQTSAFTATATDTNGISSYALSGTNASYFNINSTTGVVTFITVPDYETKTSYSIILTATDTANNSSTKNVTINIVNLDETTPTFTSASTANVNENQTSVITAHATDDSTITYSISGTDSSYFDIVSNTGVITFKTTPDYETKSSYTIIVKATDTSNNVATQNLIVNLNDVDEVAPNITSLSSYSVAENQTSAFTVTATDTSSITYSISGGADASSFNTDSTTGVVTFKTAPDYETKTSYSLTVKATDSLGNFSTKDVIVGITDVVDSIAFNNITYGIITSPNTGKRWLDRNLGATRACTSSTDTACYGDYYQWGRLADGHEKSNSTTTTIEASDISNIGNSFIMSSSYPYDWTIADSDGSLRITQWSKIDGTGVCPVGFKVPTETELTAENITNSADAFNILKLSLAGKRYNLDGSITNSGSGGYIWSNSVDIDNSTYSRGISFSSSDAYISNEFRAYGFPIRCVEGN